MSTASVHAPDKISGPGIRSRFICNPQSGKEESRLASGSTKTAKCQSSQTAADMRARHEASVDETGNRVCFQSTKALLGRHQGCIDWSLSDRLRRFETDVFIIPDISDQVAGLAYSVRCAPCGILRRLDRLPVSLRSRNARQTKGMMRPKLPNSTWVAVHSRNSNRGENRAAR